MLGRDMKLFSRCLLSAILLTALFAVLCAAAGVAALQGAENNLAPLKVNVIDNEDSTLSRILINVVMDMDYIAPLLDIEKTDYDEALRSLAEGESIAAIILPSSFVSDISAGRVAKGQIILAENASAYSDIVAEVAQFGELLLAAGQYGVFCGQQVLEQHVQDSKTMSEFLDKINADLFNEALIGQTAYFTVETADFSDTDMSAVSYYLLCWLVLLLFLSGNFFAELCVCDMKRSMLCRLRAAGVGDSHFIYGKIALPFVFRLASCAAVLLLAGRFIALNSELWPVLCFVLGIAFISLVCSTMIMLLDKGIMCNTAFAALGLFLCGGIVPRQMLSDVVLFVGDITPFGVALNLFAPVFGGELSLLSPVLAVFYSCLLLVLLHRRLNKIRSGGAAE